VIGFIELIKQFRVIISGGGAMKTLSGNLHSESYSLATLRARDDEISGT